MPLTPNEKTGGIDSIQPNEARKSLGILIVFAVLVVIKLALWLSIEKWPDVSARPYSGIVSGSEDTIVKVRGLPVRFMVFWSDSGRYWVTLRDLSQHLESPPYTVSIAFFALVRSINDSFAFAVLVLNILSLLTAWLLSRMLANCSVAFIAAVLFMGFLNLFTISTEYAIMREVLARFFLILGIFLVWRTRHSESWSLIFLTSTVLLCLGFFRQEMMVYPLAMATVFFSKITRKKAIIFIIIALMGIYGHRKIAPPTSSGNLQLDQNLLTEAYNYNSPYLGDLPRKIYEAGKKCEETYLINCQLPSIRQSVFEDEKNKLITEWVKQNPNQPFDLWGDVWKYNKKYVFYSTAYSFVSYFTGNLFTVSPFIYSGTDPNYFLGWPSYASTSLTSFGDPLSELSLNPKKRGPKWLTVSLSPLSERWYRPFCAPLFFIGLYCIAGMLFYNKFNIPEKEKTFWFLAALICIPGLAIATLVGDRTSRAVFTIDPLMIAISVLGGRVIWHQTVQRMIASIKGS